MAIEFAPVMTPVVVPAPQEGALGRVVALLPASGIFAVPMRPRLIAIGADHAAAELGLSAHPASVTADRLTALRAGSGALADAAARQNVGVRVVDLTAAGPLGISADRPDRGDALSDADLLRAVQQGKDVADVEIDAGTDLFVLALVGVGVSTAAAVLTAALTSLEPVDATTRGSGIDDAAWVAKVALVRDALVRVRSAGTDAVTVLRAAGGADVAAAVGLLAQAAARRTPVLLDGIAETAAAVLAARLAPGAAAWIAVTASGVEKPHRRLLDVLGATPMSVWSMAVSGLASVDTVGLLRSASAVHLGSGEERTARAVPSWDPELL